MIDAILTNYPLSKNFRARIDGILSGDPLRMSVTELRQKPLVEMVRELRNTRVGRLLIPVEDENGGAVLPVLTLLGGLVRSRRMEVIGPDMAIRRIPKSAIPGAFMSLLAASMGGRRSTRRANRVLDELAVRARTEVSGRSLDRLLYLNANLWFGVQAGGSIGHVAGVVNGLLGRGVDVDFFSAGAPLMIDEGVAYTHLQPPAAFGLPWEANYYRFHFDVCRQLRRQATGNYAAIYQRLSLANFSGVVHSRRERLPLIMEYNGSEAWIAKNWGRPLRFQELAEKVERINLQHAHLVVTISEPLRQDLLERGVPEERIVCYPNCTDPNVFDPDRFTQNERDALRRSYGLDPRDVVCTFVGTFGQWHGAEVLARAAVALIEDHPDVVAESRLRFLFVGDGLRMPAVREILGKHADGDFVKLVGLVPQEEAPLHLAASDILASPHVPNDDGTPFFGSPTKLFEYMAMGKAIIASELDQIGVVLENSIRHGEDVDVGAVEGTGRLSVLVEPGSKQSLVRGIRRLASDPDLRSALGRNARKEALDKYTWSRHVEEITSRMHALGLVASR